MRIPEPISGIEGVAPGADATVKIPGDRRLFRVRLIAGGTIGGVAKYGADIVDLIRVYGKGKLVRTLTAAQAFDIANVSGLALTAATDEIPIFGAEPHRVYLNDEQRSAFDLWGLKDGLTLKVGIKGTVAVPTLAALMEHDDGWATNQKGERVMNIVEHSRHFFNAGTVYDIMGLPIDKPIHRIYLYPAAGSTISRVAVVVNDVQTVHDMTPAQNKAMLKDYDLVAPAPAAGAMYPIVFDIDHQFDNALQPPRSLKVHVEQDVAGAIEALVENHAPDYL